MLHSCGLLTCVMCFLSLSNFFTNNCVFFLLSSFPAYPTTLPPLEEFEIPFPVLHDSLHIFMLEQSAVVIWLRIFLSLKSTDLFGAWSVFFTTVYHQNMAHGRQFIRFCWNNAIINVWNSMNSPEGWVGKYQRTETGLKSVAFAQVRWIPASSEQRLCAEEQGEKLD